MSTKKQHCDTSDCPLAHSLDLLGDKWTLLIMRDLIIGNKREYKELLESPESISTNILSDRLKKLEEANIISSIPHPEYKTRKFYYPTKSGKDTAPILNALVNWAYDNINNVPVPKDDRKCSEIIQDALEKLVEWEEKYLGKRL